MTDRERRIFDQTQPSEEELWLLFEGKTREEIVREVADAFSAELAEIMQKRNGPKPRR